MVFLHLLCGINTRPLWNSTPASVQSQRVAIGRPGSDRREKAGMLSGAVYHNSRNRTGKRTTAKIRLSVRIVPLKTCVRHKDRHMAERQPVVGITFIGGKNDPADSGIGRSGTDISVPGEYTIQLKEGKKPHKAGGGFFSRM